MDESTHRALRLLEDLTRRPRETGPFVLEESYLRDVERWENLPENRPGADKTWVARSQEGARPTLAARSRR